MNFGNKPKFQRVDLVSSQQNEISEEMAKVIVEAWYGVMRKLGYLTAEDPTESDIKKAVADAEADGILVLPSKRVYNDDQVIYDIVIQQIGAEIVFERGDAESNPLN